MDQDPGVITGNRLHNQETMRMAEMVRAKRELEIQAEAHGLGANLNRKKSFIEYIESLKAKSRSKGTKDSWDNALSKFKAFMGGQDVTFGMLSKGLFEDYKDYLLAIGIGQNTAQKYFATIKTALYNAERHEMIQNNPARFISIKKVESLPKFLTLDEVKKLSNTACENHSVRNAFLFSCFTGLRYGDVMRLTWDMISCGHLEFTQHKTGNSERLPLGRQALRILEEQKSVDCSGKVSKEFAPKIVFYLPRQSTTDKALRRWAERAKLGKSISFHKARHTFATLALTKGADLYTTSKLLGHRDLKTTQIYAKVVDEKKSQAVAMLPTI